MSKSNLNKEESKKLNEDFLKDFDDKQKQIEDLFSKMQQTDEKETERIVKDNQEAITKFTDIFKPKTFSLLIGDITFFFKYNLSIFEYEQLKAIKEEDIIGKLKFLHTLVVEPEIDFDLFKELPAEYIAYAEQKIYDFFLNKLTKVII
jgi:hypothetical protein